MITIPSERAYCEMSSHAETFCLDFDINGILILFLKLSPKLIISVLNGATVKIVFRNPNIERETVSLYIEDIRDCPSFWVKGAIKKENNIDYNLLPSIDEMDKYLREHTFIRIALFDFSLKNVYSQDVEWTTPDESITDWLERTMKLSSIPLFDLDSPEENEDTGYAVNLWQHR